MTCLWAHCETFGLIMRMSAIFSPRKRARAGSKLVLKPVVWLLGATGLWEAIKDREVRRKLSLFVRSRWFKPPLSGPRMAQLMYAAVTAMGKSKHRLASLLPSGQRLDLFVTVTDHYGCQQLVQIHNPPIIQELEHRHVLRFRYQRRPNGEVLSDFLFENAPALAFAARATSSFPGAFPPARLSEIDDLVAQKSVAWPQRAEFIARNFETYTRVNVDPVSACFLDGSVLNNRPFREAISAIRGRPAYRQVDRRPPTGSASTSRCCSEPVCELVGAGDDPGTRLKPTVPGQPWPSRGPG
jgi:patatin-related protein